MKILVADDDAVIRTLMCVPLRTLAYLEVIEAADGQQARALFDKNQFAAVVIDWLMPGMTGLDFTRSIRLTGSRVPILMVSGQSDRQQVIKAIKAGVTDYLIKPFDVKVLCDKVNRLLCRPTL